MSYKLQFDGSAWKEYQKLNPSIKTQFKKKITKILENPVIPANRLSGFDGNVYKIKFRTAGFRAVYYVINEDLTVEVIALGFKSDRNDPYDKASFRI